MQKKQQGVAAVNRALLIMDALGTSETGLLLSELTLKTDLYESTILRLCDSLEAYGYLYRLENGRYKVGSKVYILGELYRRSFRSSDVAYPILRALVERTGESATIYVKDKEQRLCLHRVDSPRSVRDHVHEGDRFTLDAGAAGHVIRAFTVSNSDKASSSILVDGYAVSRSERDRDTVAIACPVFGPGDQFFGALSLSMPSFRFVENELASQVDAVKGAAEELTNALGGRQRLPPA